MQKLRQVHYGHYNVPKLFKTIRTAHEAIRGNDSAKINIGFKISNSPKSKKSFQKTPVESRF